MAPEYPYKGKTVSFPMGRTDRVYQRIEMEQDNPDTFHRNYSNRGRKWGLIWLTTNMKKTAAIIEHGLLIAETETGIAHIETDEISAIVLKPPQKPNVPAETNPVDIHLKSGTIFTLPDVHPDEIINWRGAWG